MTYLTNEEEDRLLELGFNPWPESNTPTEKQVRDLQDAAETLEETFDDAWTDILEDNKWKPVVTDEFKDTVLKAKLFIVIVQEYIEKRAKIEKDWGDVENPTDAQSFDMYGDSISIQWRETDRCGDEDYYSRDFPISHLWSDNWAALLQHDENLRKEREAIRKEEAEKKRLVAVEKRERKQLQELLSKYPEEATLFQRSAS